MNTNSDNLLPQAIRYCFIVNAGAMVALLAFLGQIWGTSPASIDINPDEIVGGFRLFVVGVISAIAALLALHFGEVLKRWGSLLATLLVVFSIALFLCGTLPTGWPRAL